MLRTEISIENTHGIALRSFGVNDKTLKNISRCEKTQAFVRKSKPIRNKTKTRKYDMDYIDICELGDAVQEQE